MKNSTLFFILSLAFFFSSASTIFKHKIEFLYDEDISLNTSTILFSDFKKMPYSESFGTKNGDYWFKVTVEKKLNISERLILQIPSHNVGDIILYKRVKDSLIYIAKNEIGSNPEVVIHSRFPTFSIDIGNETKIEYYLKVYFEKEANFPLRLYASSEYYKYSYKHHIFTGAYYGFLIAIIICNLFFYIKFQEKVYLDYITFLATYTTAILFRDGTMNLILPFELPIDLEAISHLLTQITMFIFAFRFLDFKTYVPNFKKYAKGLVISMALMEVAYIVSKNFLFYVIADTVAMISFLTTWVVCIVFMLKVKFARFYILGYSILIAFGFHFLFSYDFGIIPNNARTVFLKIASTVDMLIFTYAISYRLDILNKEHKKLIQELRLLVSKNQKTTTVAFFYRLLEENELTNKILTVQEIKVLKCIHERMTNLEIAEKLFVSTNTIKFHVRNIYKKLDVKNRNEANMKLKEFNKDEIGN